MVYKEKSPAQVQNTINELKAQADVTITLQDGELLCKYHEILCLYKKLSKNNTELQGKLERKKREICALKKEEVKKVGGISDKYHKTLGLYKKLSKNYNALETKLKEKNCDLYTQSTSSNKSWKYLCCQ